VEATGVGQFFFLLISLALFSGTPREPQAQTASSVPLPKWSIELRNYGWTAPKPPSNSAFFKDFSLTKLEGLDENTRVLFVDDDVIVVYHTKQRGKDWRTASRQIEAFFISARDGSLLSRKEWPTAVRGSESDLQDSEGRLIPLSNGRFVVFANHAMMLYDSNRELVRQKTLESSASSDLWSAQPVAGGRKIFLRHQSSPKQQTTYYWLASDTLLPVSQMPGFRGQNFSATATAGEDFVLMVLGFSDAGITTGIGKIELDGSAKVICSDQFCREGGSVVVSSHCIAVSGRRGIGVVDPQQGLIWSKRIPPVSNLNGFQFGHIRSAISGDRFAVWVTASPEVVYDSVKIHSSPTLLIYDCEGSRHPPTVQIEPANGGFDFALSPDGRELAIFDGARIKLYEVE
jgi:hypothetical protein